MLLIQLLLKLIMDLDYTDKSFQNLITQELGLICNITCNYPLLATGLF